MASQTVADHLLARLREWGVEPVFGFSGDGINGLLARAGACRRCSRTSRATTCRW